jgi:branched-chain amino acid aminotransferase
VIQICHELGITVKERSIQRAALYVGDELFFSGTAAEITPIRSVDRIKVGNGARGEITERIQKAFFEITKGERPAPGVWLTYVNEQKAALPVDDEVSQEASFAGSNESLNDPEPVLNYLSAGAD